MSKPTTFITNKDELPYQDRPTSVVQRQRFCFVKDGQASPWIEKPEKQAEAIARKFFGSGYMLWRYLKKDGKIQKQQQVLCADFTWRHV